MWKSSSPGFLTLLLSTWVPFPNKISCFISTCMSLDNSFLSVRQEPSFGPWKGSLFLKQYELHDEPKEYKKSGAVVDTLSEDNIWINRSTGSVFKDHIGQNFFFFKTYRTVNGNCSQRGKICFLIHIFKLIKASQEH